jgi:hypothetical protein
MEIVFLTDESKRKKMVAPYPSLLLEPYYRC